VPYRIVKKNLELALLVIVAFEVVEMLEGDLLENGVDGLGVEALADVLQHLFWESGNNMKHAGRGGA
jgi:hypothetical protein